MKWYFSNFHLISTFSSKDVISRAYVVLLEKVSSEPGNEVSKSIHYFHIDHNAPCFPPTPPPPPSIEIFHNRYYSRPKRNPRQWLCIFFLGGGEGALWSMLQSWIVADGCYSELWRKYKSSQLTCTCHMNYSVCFAVHCRVLFALSSSWKQGFP